MYGSLANQLSADASFLAIVPSNSPHERDAVLGGWILSKAALPMQVKLQRYRKYSDVVGLALLVTKAIRGTSSSHSLIAE